jgi:hypothetical protein
VRSKESLGLTVLRKIQAAAVKGNLLSAKARVPLEAANYLLNDKRDRLLKLEQEYGIRIHVEGDATLTGSLFNLVLDKKDILPVDEDTVEAETEAFEEAEVVGTEPLEEEEAVEEIPAAPASGEVKVVDEPAAVVAATLAAVVDATLSVDINSAPAVGASSPLGNGNPLKPEAPTSSPWQPCRRRGRFWWLRHMVSSTSRSINESTRQVTADAPATDTVPAAEPVSAVHTTPMHQPPAEPGEGSPRRLPDSAAPWRRMLPPTKPLLQLPLRGADDLTTGDHLAI